MKRKLRLFALICFSLLCCISNNVVLAAEPTRIETEVPDRPTLPDGIPGVEQADVVITPEWLEKVSSLNSDSQVTSLKSSELDVPHRWEVNIRNRVVTATIYNKSGVNDAYTLLSIADENGKTLESHWSKMQNQSSTLTLDLSDTKSFPNGKYKISIWEGKQVNASVYQLSSYDIQIVKGVISFAPGGCSAIEQAFIKHLNENYNPKKYNSVPLKYFPVDANENLDHYVAKNINTIIAKAKKITAKCTTDEQKTKAIHDWICKNFAYDYECLSSNDISKQANVGWVYKNKRAVCSGFSRLNQVMLTSVGVPCMDVFGPGEGNPNNMEYSHEWNVVYLNGSWRIIDLTWDCANQYHGKNSDKNVTKQAPDYQYYGIPAFSFGYSHHSVDLQTNITTRYPDTYVKKIALKKEPTKYYNKNDKFSEKYVVKTTMSDGTKKTVNLRSKDCASGYNMKKGGWQTVVVKYGGKSVKYSILVVAKGVYISDGHSNYVFTSTGKKKEVAYVAPMDKNAKAITVISAFSVGEDTYNVTAIQKNAFKNCKKLKKIVINTTKLKADTVGKNAFSGIHKNAVIKVPADKLSAYKKIFKKRGLPKTAKITK